MPVHTDTSFTYPVDRGGRLSPYARTQIAAVIQTFAGSSVHISVGPARRSPTPRQRGYYFPVVVGTYAEFAGYTKNEAHLAFKLALLGLEPAEGGRLPKVRSIRSLPPAAFRDYVDDCRRIAAEMGCQTKDPDPAWRLGGYEREHAAMGAR